LRARQSQQSPQPAQLVHELSPTKVEEEQDPLALHLTEDAEEEEEEDQVSQQQEQFDRLKVLEDLQQQQQGEDPLEQELEREHDKAAEQVHKGYIRKTLWASQ
jgi:hypothetical protein